MKIISWNVNGIRAVIKKGFLDFLQKEKPDVLCLQEIKISQAACKKEQFDFPGFKELWNSAERPGYSGTLTLVKNNLSAEALPLFKWDDEGRVQIFKLNDFYLANVYFINAKPGLARIDYKIKFNDRLLKIFKKLEKEKPVIVCGDFNVAHQEIDLARPKQNVGSPGFSEQERSWISKFLKSDFVDIYRQLHPNKIQYTWWSYRAGARKKNVGWRIDYFCVSKKISKKIKKAYILDKIEGSDHCPVGINLAD